MKALSLFSGIGGIDLAAEWAGIETVAFCEREPFCQKVLAKHWPNIPIYDDVCTLTKERLKADGIGTIDLIFGGYPCQPFSVAGNREGENDDRHLWPEVFRLLQEINPDWFVGENVAGHVTLGLDTVLSDLENIGYATQSFIIPACSVDAPHRRDRVFIIAHSNRIRWNDRLDHWEKRYFQSDGKRDVAESESEWDGWLDRFGKNGSVHANTASERLEGKQRQEFKGDGMRFADSSKNVPHSTSIGSQGQGESIESIHTKTNEDRETSESIHERIDSQWATEPNVGRVANGVPGRVDRLKALGNAVVPQQIYPILAAIKQINDMLQAENKPSEKASVSYFTPNTAQEEAK